MVYSSNVPPTVCTRYSSTVKCGYKWKTLHSVMAYNSCLYLTQCMHIYICIYKPNVIFFYLI